jgi:site-specific recombinase XerD
MLAKDWGAELDAHVQNELKTAGTVKVYKTGLRIFLEYLSSLEIGRPVNVADITTKHCRDYLTHLRTAKGFEASTVVNRYIVVKMWFSWLIEVEVLTANPMTAKDMRPPLPDKDPTTLSPAQIQAMLDTVKGKDFRSVRDNALIRLMSSTGCRIDEIAQLFYNPDAKFNNHETAYLDLERNVIHVLGKGAGKGKKRRTVKFDATTATALRTYRRARQTRLNQHHTSSDALWLSTRGTAQLGYTGVYEVIVRAAKRAGLGPVHPHQLRHSAADRAMRAASKGLITEGDICKQFGWSDRRMLDRYAKDLAEERAHTAYERAGLGAF